MNNINLDDVIYHELANEQEDANDEVFLIEENDQNDSQDEEANNKGFKHKPGDWRKDVHNIIFLMFLYFLQGVPLGLTGSLPFILSSRKVSYADQGTFSFAFWPFSLKLLWAPLVDSLYVKKFGRRKSWLVPMQYIMGIFMIVFADYVHQLLEVDKNDSNLSKDIYILTLIFCVLTFFAATQDIAVDGWGLTILSKENVSWSSTCNSAGQTAGWFVGGVLFLVFQSADFSNKYIRSSLGWQNQDYGLITVDKFMTFFGVVFLLTTTFIIIFKNENNSNSDSEPEQDQTPTRSLEDNLSVCQTYKLIWPIINLSSVRKLALLLLTGKIAFALQSMSYLKLIEKGVPKESIGLLAIPLTPFEVLLPLVISKFTNGPTPLRFFLNSYPFRILTAGLIVMWVYVTPYFQDSVTKSYPFYYFILCLIVNALYSTTANIQSVSLMSFFTRISDKTVGGTYMTLLNTISNLGSHWPHSLAFYMVHFFSIKTCQIDQNSYASKYKNQTLFDSNFNNTNLTSILRSIDKNKCYSDVETRDCEKLGANCLYIMDAYYILAIICSIIGLIWLLVSRKTINNLQSMGKAAWKIRISSQ